MANRTVAYGVAHVRLDCCGRAKCSADLRPRSSAENSVRLFERLDLCRCRTTTPGLDWAASWRKQTLTSRRVARLGASFRTGVRRGIGGFLNHPAWVASPESTFWNVARHYAAGADNGARTDANPGQY